jgi:uncharacterized membrane protein
MSGALKATNLALPSMVVLPATGLYVGAVAAVVPATEQRYHIPFAVGGLRIIAVV